LLTGDEAKVTEVQSSIKFNTDPTSELKKDWRLFECITWQLEPSVR